jgi:hypothetical protein
VKIQYAGAGGRKVGAWSYFISLLFWLRVVFGFYYDHQQACLKVFSWDLRQPEELSGHVQTKSTIIPKQKAPSSPNKKHRHTQTKSTGIPKRKRRHTEAKWNVIPAQAGIS